MKAHVDQNFLTGEVSIWLFLPLRPPNKIHYLASGSEPVTFEWIEAAEGEEPPGPTLRMHREMAEAMASALATFGRPEEATQRHLTDAIKVRDRLLTLIEAKP